LRGLNLEESVNLNWTQSFRAALGLAILLLATSCGSDSNGPAAPSIAGTWKSVEYTLVLSANGIRVTGTGTATFNNPPNGLTVDGTYEVPAVRLNIVYTDDGNIDVFVGQFVSPTMLVGQVNGPGAPDTLRKQ
jgi:hypothetical protein